LNGLDETLLKVMNIINHKTTATAAPKLEAYATSNLSKFEKDYKDYLKNKYGLTKLIMVGEIEEPKPQKLTDLDKKVSSESQICQHEARANFRGKSFPLELTITF
jgi:hypothetical protein